MTDSPVSTLICPKCQGAMRTYERNGVTIDQCVECRGIFLDRGELERLIDAEEQRYERPPMPPPTPEQTGYRSGDQGGHHGDSSHGSKHGGKRKRGFLGELFD